MTISQTVKREIPNEIILLRRALDLVMSRKESFEFYEGVKALNNEIEHQFLTFTKLCKKTH